MGLLITMCLRGKRENSEQKGFQFTDKHEIFFILKTGGS